MKILVIGHVDHGKTTFIRALNHVLYSKYGIGTEESSLSTVNKANIVTAQESLHYTMGNIEYAFYDYPGYADYLDMFEAGKETFDAALLVCAASDGAMGQTIDLLHKALESGIQKFVVFLSKLDLVEDLEFVELMSFDLIAEMEEAGCNQDVPIIRGSALQVLETSSEESFGCILDIMSAVHKMFV